MIYQGLDRVLGTITKMCVVRALMQLDSPVPGGEAKRLTGVRSADALWTGLDELNGGAGQPRCAAPPVVVPTYCQLD